MESIKRILVPTDFSPISTQAVEFASGLAEIHNAQLDIVHVFEEPAFPSFYGAGALVLYGKVPDIKKEAVAALEELAQPLGEQHGIPVNTHMLEGHASTEICDFAEKNQIDLIVIPTYGLTGLKHIVMGSVAEKVVREASCPVFVYKIKPDTPPDTPNHDE